MNRKKAKKSAGNDYLKGYVEGYAKAIEDALKHVGQLVTNGPVKKVGYSFSMSVQNIRASKSDPVKA